MKNKLFAFLTLALLATFNSQLSTAFAQGTAFTYQGRLNSGTNLATGSHDLTFALFSVSSGAGQVGGTITNSATAISNGLFTVTLDFSNQFPGADRWLEIGVRTNGGGTFTTLAPRQKITPTPYAITAGNVTGVVASGSLSGTYSSPVTFNNAGNSFSGNGSNLTSLNANSLSSGQVPSAALSNAWQITGNSGTTAGTHFLGTTDNQPLEIKVNGLRALRFEPKADVLFKSGIVNVVGGSSANFVGAGVYGATIGGGGALSYFGNTSNRVEGDFGTVSGGLQNTIQGNADHATIGGGLGNTTQNNASFATIPGGRDNSAADYAFAAGRRAKANHTGAFVWADSTDADFASTGTNQFLIRASGNVGINVTNPVDSLHVQSGSGLRVRATTTGTGFAGFLSENSLGEWFAGVATGTNHWYLFENAPSSGARLVVKSGGNVGIGTTNPTNKLHVIGGVSATVFVTTSDRNAKEHFAPVSPREVLAKVVTLPISTWNFKDMRDGRHMGPMAQDFHAAFGLGSGDTTITTIDPDGVALAAIQGLNEKTEVRSQKSEVRIKKLEAENAELKQRLEKLERLMTEKNGDAK